MDEDELTPEMQEEYKHPTGCTCERFNWPPHSCPLAEEIHGDDSPCTCCPVCTINCEQDI